MRKRSLVLLCSLAIMIVGMFFWTPDSNAKTIISCTSDEGCHVSLFTNDDEWDMIINCWGGEVYSSSGSGPFVGSICNGVSVNGG